MVDEPREEEPAADPGGVGEGIPLPHGWSTPEDPYQGYSGKLLEDYEQQAARHRLVPWTARDVFAIVGLVIVVFFGFSILFGVLLNFAEVVYPALNRQEFVRSPLANSLLWLLQWSVTLGVTFTYLKIRGYRLSASVLGFRRTRLGHAVLYVIGVIFLSFVIQGIYVQYVVPEQEQVTELFGQSILSFVAAMIIVAVLTPIVEELFFRGIIHQGLAQRFGFIPGAIMSSVLFMLAHVDPTVFLPIFALGFGFAFLMTRTRSLWPSIAAHMLWNSLGVTAQFFASGN